MVAASGLGLVRMSLLHLVVLLGVAVVLPLALGGRPGWWAWAATAVLASFLLPVGWAGLFVLPLVAAVAATLAVRLVRAGPFLFWRAADVVDALATVYALVAAGALVVSRSGFEVLGFQEPIVELAAVHYIYAGAAALVLAGRASASAGADGAWRRTRRAAVAFTAVAPPVVAAGFITGHAGPQVGGAVLMTVGVWLTAGFQLRDAAGARSPAVTALLGISGLAVWVPMVLAVAWAAGQHWAIPVLSIPDMARTHGLANALAFVLCGLAGRHVEAAKASARRAVAVVA